MFFWWDPRFCSLYSLSVQHKCGFRQWCIIIPKSFSTDVSWSKVFLVTSTIYSAIFSFLDSKYILLILNCSCHFSVPDCPDLSGLLLCWACWSVWTFLCRQHKSECREIWFPASRSHSTQLVSVLGPVEISSNLHSLLSSHQKLLNPPLLFPAQPVDVCVVLCRMPLQNHGRFFCLGSSGDYVPLLVSPLLCGIWRLTNRKFLELYTAVGEFYSFSREITIFSCQGFFHQKL